ncbi:hypothetical protein BDZ45DRAFT_739405 [Acephala macrosclerotiorum]|nr:hypothetical protein BDZ45DRAFT_739405 [Acephala macrosclerotiorum]
MYLSYPTDIAKPFAACIGIYFTTCNMMLCVFCGKPTVLFTSNSAIDVQQKIWYEMRIDWQMISSDKVRINVKTLHEEAMDSSLICERKSSAGHALPCATIVANERSNELGLGKKGKNWENLIEVQFTCLIVLRRRSPALTKVTHEFALTLSEMRCNR